MLRLGYQRYYAQGGDWGAGGFMKRNRAFAGLPMAAPRLVLEVSRRVLPSVPFTLVCLLAQAAFPQQSVGQAPVYEITPVESSIKFDVESSVAIKGTFSKWNATLTFQTRELSTGVLDIKIEADSVDTGSGLKNGKLRGKDFFNVKEEPYITFRSTKITQTGPLTFELDGDFTIRGVTKKEKLKLTDSGKGSPTGFIIGTMAFDRKDYGMNSGIPFIKIANRVEVNVNLKWNRISGLPPAFEQ